MQLLPQLKCFDCLLSKLQRKFHYSAKTLALLDLLTLMQNTSVDCLAAIKKKIHKAEWSVCGFYQRAKEEWVTVEWVTQIFFSRVSLSSFQLHISLLISVCTFFLTPLKQSDRWVEDYWQGKGQRPLLWRNHSDWQIIIRSREHSLPEIPLNSLHFLMLFIQVSFWYEDSSHLIFFGIDDNGIYIFFAWKLDQNSSINPQKWQIQNSKPPFHLLIGRSMFEFGTRRGLLYLLLFPAPSS